MLLLFAPAAALVAFALIKVKQVADKHIKDNSSSNSLNRIAVEKNTYLATLVILNTEYKVEFEPTQASMQEAAISFCSHHGDVFGISVKTFPDCVQYVVGTCAHYYQVNSSGIKSMNESTSLAAIPPPQPPFFVTNPSILSNVGNGTDAREDDVTSKSSGNEIADTSISSSFDSVSLEVNGLTYQFDFPSPVTMEVNIAAEKLATKFCSQQAQELLKQSLDSFSEEMLWNQCGRPLSEALANAIEQKRTTTTTTTTTT